MRKKQNSMCFAQLEMLQLIFIIKKDDKKKDNILKKGGKCDIIWLSFMEEFEIVEERRIGV
ncbi:MAG: hypothetical protein IKQ25_12170 [Lachnospiraceae bacterium]|nr:hypothetical protein [Lachnospiraceae bacterium]